MNKLILGDNLEILKNIDSESVDLIYIDPPFFSNRTYEVIWGDEGEVRSFQDRFSGGIDHYIAWLKERVVELHRILKSTGSIFIHCDWHANAHIRVQILDKVFGNNCFRNEIIWKRTNNPKGSQFEKRSLGVATDTIWYYSKRDNDSYTFNENFVRKTLQNGELAAKYPQFDDKGRYTPAPIIRGQSMGERPNLVYEYKGFTPEKWGWRMTKDKLEELDKAGDIGWSKNGKPFRKLRPENDKGDPIYNFWGDIPRIYSGTKEAIGYPTQKPEALLERIIRLSSNEGDIILDCFMGGGTTIAVADRLNRKWIGIDQSVQAVKVTEFRLNAQQGRLIGKTQDMFAKPFITQLYKYDYDTLRYKNAFEFETWIIQQYGGIPNTKQRSELGIDGRTSNNQPIQVKRSDNIGRNVIDNFHSAVMRYDKSLYEKNKLENKPVGFVIAFSFGKGAIQEVARLKVEEQIIIELVTVETIVPIAKKPTLQVVIEDLGKIKEMRQIQFTATGESEAGIEFYAWDFGYNEQNFTPEILLDKTGKQTYLFKAGEHKIAVKVVDNEGLESLEVIKLKVNGVVQRN